jgi:hypothetical protein
MLRFRRRTVSRPRAVVCGTVVLFVAAQLGLGVFLTRVRPEVREPEYGSLCNSLHARLAEWPGRPLVLVLGSSRSANLFRPTPPGPEPDPLVFNFATLYTGPVREVQVLRRLLTRGVRPRWVVAEVWAPFLTQRGGFAEEIYIGEHDLQPVDAPVVGHYFARPRPAYGKLAEGALAPAFSHRAQLLAAYSPFLDRPGPTPGDWSYPDLRVEGFGWLPVPEPKPDPWLLRAHLEKYAEVLREVLADFRVSPVADGALRELIRTCADHGIGTALVLCPEHGAMRACCPPEVEARLEAYLGGLAREHGVLVVDTRDWMPDEDFFDSRHVLPHAAAPYTERFGREVLRPLTQGRPLPSHVLLGHSPSPSPQGPSKDTGGQRLGG